MGRLFDYCMTGDWEKTQRMALYKKLGKKIDESKLAQPVNPSLLTSRVISKPVNIKLSKKEKQRASKTIKGLALFWIIFFGLFFILFIIWVIS